MARTLEAPTTMLVEQQCWCGLWFALPKSLHRQLHDEGHTVYCPLRHLCSYKETEASRLKLELEKEAKKREQLETQLRYADESAQFYRDEGEETRKRLAITRGQLTKTRKRVGNSVCPICNRSFTVLLRHMANKHPEYAAAEAE